jgi:hypothetical protein
MIVGNGDWNREKDLRSWRFMMILGPNIINDVKIAKNTSTISPLGGIEIFILQDYDLCEESGTSRASLIEELISRLKSYKNIFCHNASRN